MATTKIEITTDQAKAEAGYKKLEAAEASVQAASRQTSAVSQQSARQMAAAHEAGATTSAAAYNRIIRELRKTGPEGRAQAKALEAHLRDATKAGRRSIDAMIGELDGFDNEAARVARNAGQDFERAGKKGREAFGEKMVGNLKAMAAGYVSLSAAAEVYLRAVERARDTTKETVDTLTQTTDGNQKLLQVAENEEDFRALTGRADELAGKFGIAREAARDLVFSARSEGFEGSLDFIARNAGNRVISADAQATVAGQVPALFQAEGIGANEAINATLVAAQQSRLDFEQISRALPTVAASAAPGGSSFDESVATLSVLAGQFKSGDQAGDRISAFAAKLNLDERFQGQGITASTEMLQGMSEADRAAFLGDSKELNEAYNAIAGNLDTIRQRTGQIRGAREATGTEAAATDERVAIAEATPAIQAVREKQAAENRLEIERERRRATTESKRQRDTANALANAERTGVDERRIGLAENVAEAGAAVFGGGGEATAIEAITGAPLQNLIRDFALANQNGDPLAEAGLLAATRLRNRRRSEGATAIASADTVAGYLNATTDGEMVSPANITEEQRIAFTSQLERQAGQARGLERTLTASAIDLFGRDTPFVRGAFQGAAGEGSDAAAQFRDSIAELTAAVREGTEAQKETAKNTGKKPPAADVINANNGARVPNPL